ncbi:hypothetical protein AAFX24_27615 [Vibrio mediterranei]|uniref:hypothetical protein n=1 Tax=Vibrio mediterranei TaxID=689 RepID=UPI0038CED471
MSMETEYFATARLGRFSIRIEAKGSFLDAYLECSVPFPNKVKLQCKMTYRDGELHHIEIIDFTGTGDVTPKMCRQGYGTLFVSSVLGFLHNQSKHTSSPVRLSGEMSTSQSVDVDASHIRRAKFWQRMGLPPVNPYDQQSKIRGEFGKNGCGTTPYIPPSHFYINTDVTDTSHWQDEDEVALEKLLAIDLSIDEEDEMTKLNEIGEQVEHQFYQRAKLTWLLFVILLVFILFKYQDPIVAIGIGAIAYFSFSLAYLRMPRSPKLTSIQDQKNTLRFIVGKKKSTLRSAIDKLETDSYGILKRALHHYGIKDHLAKCNQHFQAPVIRSYHLHDHGLYVYRDGLMALKRLWVK